MWVAGGLQRLIAGEELANVAAQIGQDSLSGAEEGPAQAFVATYRNAASAPAGSFPPVPEDKTADVLKACKVSAEKLTSEVGTGLFAKTVIQAAAVSVKMVNINNTANTADTGRKPHAFVRPVLAGARTVTSLAYRVAYVGPWAQKPAFAGLALIVLGAFASTSAISVLSAGGVFAVLAGLLLVAVSTRTIVPVLAILAFVAGAALAAAAYVPFLRDHLFPWLQKSVIPGFAKRPAEWAILVLFVLLPPLWTIPAILRQMITTIIRRMRRSAATVPTPTPTSSTPATATAEPEPLAESA
jgi:hypothetical protein